MIEVTKLNGQHLVINADHIERIEARPDTILSLASGSKIIVRESVREMISRLIEYRRALLEGPNLEPGDVLHHEVVHGVA